VHIFRLVSRMSQFPDSSQAERFSLVLWPGSKAALRELQDAAKAREGRFISQGEVIRQLLKKEAARIRRSPAPVVEVRRDPRVA
jgi:Arc/MetJ-type ribon-helix-helix transcriptional regulator